MTSPESATSDFDVVVLGLGVGGEAAAGRLAKAGLRVAGIEDRLVGGECPYYGCIPTKMMIRAGNALAEARRIPDLAGNAQVSADWSPVARRVREEATDTWDDKVAVDRLVDAGVHFVRGRGRLTGPAQVTVDGEILRASRGIILATGTKPSVPPIPGLAATPFWTNQDAVRTETVPESLIVLGGGAIGVELAQVFARFGAAVTVIEAAPQVISHEEPEAGALICEVFAREGITVRANVRAEAVSYDGRAFTVRLSDGDPLVAQQVLVSAGRNADLADLGVDAIGLDPHTRLLSVDSRLKVAPRVWAIGDVTEHGGFTHMAMYHADIVVRDILAEGGPNADYRAVPRVTFTDPEIGAVGLTEAQAREKNIAVRTGIASASSSSRGFIHGPGNDGFIKLVADADRDILIGATTAGPTGGEVLSALTLAIQAATPLDTLRQTIWAYPTFHRGISDALAALT
jgi:pyruvate/2-oxoglutarate dehydrogenase complex dihydrolipoamide dehydrogenase (E3) component